MRRLIIGLPLILSACNLDAVEGTYYTDDSEGSRATMMLKVASCGSGKATPINRR